MVFTNDSQRGQVLLIVILILVVTLTIGLSVVSRTITNLRTTREDENSKKAFSAAEAGIEKIINSGTTALNGTFSGDTTYTAEVSNLGGTSLLVNNGNAVFKDDGVDVWLSAYPSYSSPFSGTVTIYWGMPNSVCSSNQGTNSMAALEVLLIHGSTSSPQMIRYGIDPCSQRGSSNNFTTAVQAGGTIEGKSFPHSYSISVTDGLLMRIVPLYATTSLGINGNGTSLPVQGQVIESTGSSGETQRKITVYRGYPKVPVEFFQYGIFSH